MVNMKTVDYEESAMDAVKEGEATSVTANDTDELLLKVDDMRIPTVQNKAKDKELNFNKQYKRKLEFCDREFFVIHDKESNLNDKNGKGSPNKSCVYFDLNAGIFEAAKINLVKVLEETLNVTLVKKPKVETYGTSQAMERILLDLKMTVNN